MSVAAPISAAQAIGEFLQSPDDLLKIMTFRKKLEKEKGSIDARLKSGVKEQLDATREGLRKLLRTRNNVQVIKDEMETVETECSDPRNVVTTFDQISRVSTVHRNFEQTEEMVHNLLEMNSRLDSLEYMLEADSQDILGPAPNLLPMHFQINQLEGFRNTTLHQAKKASADSRARLAQWFERLNKVIEAFDEYILALAQNLLPLVREGHAEVIVKLIKIAEIEGREDEKAVAIRLVKKAAKLDAASKFKSMQATARILKYYRSKINKAVIESIKHKFANAFQQYAQDPGGLLADIDDWIYNDLYRVETDIAPCFPPDYDMYAIFAKEYHKALNGTIKRVLDAEPEASMLLIIHQWVKDYKNKMKELEVPPEYLEPALLEGNEQSLIDDYLKLIIKKLDEWTANLMKTEVNDFTARSEPPEIDSDGMYGMQGAVILFQMVNQQVDVATESGQGAILAQVVSDVNRIMRGVQSQWIKLLEAEFKKQTEKPEEMVGGLDSYSIALANDQIKSADNTETLLARLEGLVSEKYRVTINERLNDAIDGYLDVAKKCIQILIGVIFNDLKAAMKQLFTPPWYDGIMVQIVETMRDYMSDCQEFLNSALLDHLVDDLLETFIVSYLTALAHSSKLKMPAATDRIKEDIGLVFEFFSTVKPAKDLEVDFEVIEMMLGLLEASQSMVFLSYWSFAKVHGPNIPFVENLMKARGDLDRSGVNDVMDSVKRKVKEENLSDPPQPTIMKKVVIQGAISRFLQR
ncbi:exocyst complex component Sec6 [Athelia psychrophila]|uniref:Exocyst complex component Sec6 n=1 Tax=Athelia psychrophila TaxID=1759441 RepID=A0A166FAJ7_9AGAM|nr:exocyst complex component Sec6 [Fibularhizoctonia sp. CBS 109695]